MKYILKNKFSSKNQLIISDYYKNYQTLDAYIFNKSIVLSMTFLFAFLSIVTGNDIDNNQEDIEVDSTGILRKVFSPIVISKAPTNEATLVFINQDLLKIFFINRPGEGDKMMSISSVDGLNWNQAEKEFDLPGEAYYANQILVDRKGTIHCVFHIRGEGSNGYKGRTYDLWYCKKQLNEKWTTPYKIFEGYVGSMRSFIQLNSGRILIAFGKAVPEFSEKPLNNDIDYGWNEIIALYSDDYGEKWRTSNSTLRVVIDSNKNTRYGAVEPDIIQLQNGKLWMLIRTNKGFLYESLSSDDGNTWTEPQPSKFISSDSPADILRLRDGRLIVFLNMNQRWDDPQSYAFGGREVLHAIISNDDGKTWRGAREVLRTNEKQDNEVKGDRGTSYTSSIETKDGKILFVSGQGNGKFISIFDPDWLEQDAVSESTSIDPFEWTLFGANGISREHLKSEKRVKFTYTDYFVGPSYRNNIVKNFPLSMKGKISFNIEFLDSGASLLLAFNDHFSVSADTIAAKYSSFDFILSNTFKEKEVIPVKIVWDIYEDMASLYVFDKVISSKSINRRPKLGINYLRVGYLSLNRDDEDQGFILDSFNYHHSK